MAEPKTKGESFDGENYEILPQKEIRELKEELRKLKEFEVTPSKKMQVSMVELNTKLDKLLSIFEEATTSLELEEGGLSFKDKMKPVIDRMNKVLEQNSEIAQGIVAVADLVKDLREDMGKGVTVREHEGPEPIPIPPRGVPHSMPPPRTMPQPMPRVPSMPVPSGMPPPGIPPPPPRKRRFGL